MRSDRKDHTSSFKCLFLLVLILYCKGTFAQPAVKYTYDAAGNRVMRKVTVLPCNNCNQTGRTASGKESPKTNYNIGVFPNPTQEKLNVNIENYDATKSSCILLTDESGKTLWKTEQVSDQNCVNLEAFQPGVYILKITIGQDTQVYKILKI